MGFLPVGRYPESVGARCVGLVSQTRAQLTFISIMYLVESRAGLPDSYSESVVFFIPRRIMNIMKKNLYQVVLTPEPEGGYTVTVPVLPGCISYGRTIDEAREMIADAIQGYLVSMRKHHESIPQTSHESMLTSVLV